MFNELTKLFDSKQKERRHSPRKKVRFNVMWVRGPGDFVPGICTEMSLNGLLLASKTAPQAKVFDCVIDVGTRKVRLRLTTARAGSLMRGGEQWSVLGCQFTGIAADDYDALVRVLKDMAEVGNKAQAELAAIDKTDDAYRMLPMRIQQRVLETLVRMGRLEMPQGTTQPLLRMTNLGVQAGKQRVAVHSRLPGGANGDPQSFDSVLVIEESGVVKVES